MGGPFALGMVEDRPLMLQRGSDRADEVCERGIAAAQCGERHQSGGAGLDRPRRSALRQPRFAWMSQPQRQ